MSYAQQSIDAGRHILPDLVRAFAIIGIAVVNVGLFAYAMDLGYFDGGYQTQADKGAVFLVYSLFMMKSYTLFSFMFGVGFAYQIQSAKQAEAGFGGRYFRRIIGLLILGVAHIAFGFQGDILLLYGLLGAALFLFRNSSVKKMVVVASILIGLQILLGVLVAASVEMGTRFAPDEMVVAASVEMGTRFAPDEMAVAGAEVLEKAQRSKEIFGGGGFMEAVHRRFYEYGAASPIFIYQGFGVFGYFLLGLAAVKSGLISNPTAAVWSKFRRFALPIGVLGSGVGGWFFISAETFLSPETMWGMALVGIFAPLSTAGYLGLIAKWAAAAASPIKTFMARGGTATLSAYLLQSLLLSFIFNNYGLGLFGQLGAATCIAIALAVALFTLVFSSLWRKKFKLGPMEALLRGWTYLGAK